DHSIWERKRKYPRGSFALGTDESHYVLFSRHLAWGYFDHPPMVAFLAALTTLAGDGMLCLLLRIALSRGLSATCPCFRKWILNLLKSRYFARDR
ncbi:MAG: hypothetical protein MUP08_08090, partial [Desulfobulbaceae bacterium]|nr:hypothetical protein [Desulfobulbaceae bacterium]